MLRSCNPQVHAQELVVKGQPARVMRLTRMVMRRDLMFIMVQVRIQTLQEG